MFHAVVPSLWQASFVTLLDWYTNVILYTGYMEEICHSWHILLNFFIVLSNGDENISSFPPPRIFRFMTFNMWTIYNSPVKSYLFYALV